MTPGRSVENPSFEAQQQAGASLLLEVKKKQLVYEEDNTKKGNIVSWSPPVPNWNPWTSCNIDEGHMASVSNNLIQN